MKNKDVMNQTQLEIAQRISNAAKEGNTEEFQAGLLELFQNIQEQIMAEAAGVRNSADSAVLAQRGVRQLTTAENEFYNKLITTMKATGDSNPMMALSGTDKTFPLTIINQVMEDMKQEHPLLAEVDTVSATGLMKYLMNTDEGDNAVWGDLEEAITKEISSGFVDLELGQFKLSAWMPISIDMLELGANWLDTYVRTCLSEALAIGFENGIVNGTGKKQPIGMNRSVADDVVTTGGVYPKKTAHGVTRFDPTTYGKLLSLLARTRTGKPRAVRGLIMVINPVDYFKLFMPATTGYVNGQYANDILPVPTKVVTSVAVDPNEAILGMGKRYFLGIGGRRGIQFSDDYKFLEDKRYYKIVAYANGRPKDDNSFLRLDISNLKRFVAETMQVTSENYFMNITVKSDKNSTVLSKNVTDLQSDIVVGQNEITGTLKYVTGWTQFSSKTEEQSGNYLALSVDTDRNAEKITVELVNDTSGRGPVTLDSDKDAVFRITDKDVQYIEVKAYKAGEVSTRTFHLDGLVLETE
ncbi:MAG: phage major capsid protein [Lachnospiraceae bacterium]|nr:phage major capsid protein [Lachnospiraceae bacterium]MBR1852679.1 phage major capsid protein [Lachnospiraceae bacterium]